MNPMTVSPMPADQFWQIIDHAAKSAQDRDVHVKVLRTTLRKLNLEELISFEVTFRRYLNTAYTWDLCGAAAVINCGCSDDGFFRRWLVSRGRDVSMRLPWQIQTAWPNWKCSRMSGVFWEFEKIYY